MEKWQPKQEEESGKEINITTSNGEYELNRSNARLYTHLGQLAMYDHVFVSGQEKGFYIFKFVENFNALSTAMIEREYPAYLNQTEASQVDIDAYNRLVEKSIGDIDHIPDDWK